MTTTTTNYADMLQDIRERLTKAAGVECSDEIGAFLPIRKYNTARGMGEFSSLSEWLDDVADTLADFLAEEGEELEDWYT